MSCPCEDTLLAVEPVLVENEGWSSLPLPALHVQPWLTGQRTATPPAQDLRAVDHVTLRSLRSVVLLV
jgi:hypothetical protein